jgi:hypothetical protein
MGFVGLRLFGGTLNFKLSMIRLNDILEKMYRYLPALTLA